MDELVDAISTLAKEQTGALITFEKRSNPMIDYHQIQEQRSMPIYVVNFF